MFYISKINNGGLIATLGHYKQYRNIDPSTLQTSECQNNLEILCDTKNKWFSYQSASLCVHSKNTLINHEDYNSYA